MKKLVCPVSRERVNENTVRATALWVVILSLVFILIPNPYIPLFLAFDFYVRGFTRSKYSLLSRFSQYIVKVFKLEAVMIDKAPKVFAARIGLLFSLAMLILTILQLPVAAISAASVLVLFAFLECGLNFCAGCWVYTYIVLPIYRK